MAKGHVSQRGGMCMVKGSDKRGLAWQRGSCVVKGASVAKEGMAKEGAW